MTPDTPPVSDADAPREQKENPMDISADLIEAAKIVTNSLTQFSYGEIDTATSPYIGDVSLTPAQYRALVDLADR